MRPVLPVLCLGAALVLSTACSEDSPTDVSAQNNGPWVGNWVQVNFLTSQDNGVWHGEDPTGVGFVASITPSQWVETDEHGAGCALTMSYSVGGDGRYFRKMQSVTPNCPPGPWDTYTDTGRLEFSSDGTEMIQWFDLVPGDDLVAFKWARR